MKTLTIELPDDAEKRLREFASKRNTNAANAAADLVQRALSQPSPPTAGNLSAEQRSQALHEYVNALPRIDVRVDDSRESIYEGRGL